MGRREEKTERDVRLGFRLDIVARISRCDTGTLGVAVVGGRGVQRAVCIVSDHVRCCNEEQKEGGAHGGTHGVPGVFGH